MTKKVWDLRNRFLELGGIKDNKYFRKYLAFIELAYTKKTKFGQLHHSIPVSYYKKSLYSSRADAEAVADSDQYNLKVRLNRAEHILAHCFIVCFTTNKQWKKWNLYAIAKWLDVKRVSIKWCRQHINYHSSQPVYIRKRCWLSKGSERKIVSIADLDKYLADGWRKGKKENIEIH